MGQWSHFCIYCCGRLQLYSADGKRWITRKFSLRTWCQQKLPPFSITGSRITTHSYILLLPGEQKRFCQVNYMPQSSRSLPMSILQLEKQRHRTKVRAELRMDSRALSPDLCTFKSYDIHLASVCPWPNNSKKSLTPVQNDQDFMTYYLKGGYTTQWRVNEKTQPNSSHNRTLKGQGATVRSCSKGNSIWIEGKSLFTTRVVKHWSRALPRLWDLRSWRFANCGWPRL